MPAREGRLPYKYGSRTLGAGEPLEIASKDRLLGAIAVGAAASIWGTLGLFAKILYAEGVSFEALVAVRAGVGWTTMLIFVLLTRGAGSLRVAGRDLLFLVPLGLVGIGAFYRSEGRRV